MKNFTASLLFFLFSFCGFAQDNNASPKKSKMKIDEERFFRIGAKAGVNINKIPAQSYKQGFNYNYQVGAFLQFNFSNRYGLQPEVSFVQTSSEFTNDASIIYYDLMDGSQKSATLNYLEIPLLLNINVGSSKHVKLQIGPSYGCLLNSSSDTTSQGVYKNGEMSAIGGLWIQLPFFNIGARYKMGLTNINASRLSNDKWRREAIQIFAGVTF